MPAASAGKETFEEFLASEGLLRPEDHPLFGAYWRLPAKVRFSESANRFAAAGAPGEHTRRFSKSWAMTKESALRSKERASCCELPTWPE